MNRRLWGVWMAVVMVAGTSVPAAVFTVTDPGDAGMGTLRWAITEANSNPGADVIAFNLAPLVPILPGSALPGITDRVIIDGTTQPGYSGEANVVLDGTSAGVASGLRVLSATSVVIRALHVRHWTTGITLQNAVSNEVLSCVLWSNQIDGVMLDNAADSWIGTVGFGNRIVHNGDAGIRLAGGATRNKIQGNAIGNDGTDVRGNDTGIEIMLASYNTIGGTGPFDGNLISGNTEVHPVG